MVDERNRIMLTFDKHEATPFAITSHGPRPVSLSDGSYVHFVHKAFGFLKPNLAAPGGPFEDDDTNNNNNNDDSGSGSGSGDGTTNNNNNSNNYGTKSNAIDRISMLKDAFTNSEQPAISGLPYLDLDTVWRVCVDTVSGLSPSATATATTTTTTPVSTTSISISSSSSLLQAPSTSSSAADLSRSGSSDLSLPLVSQQKFHIKHGISGTYLSIIPLQSELLSFNDPSLAVASSQGDEDSSSASYSATTATTTTATTPTSTADNTNTNTTNNTGSTKPVSPRQQPQSDPRKLTSGITITTTATANTTTATTTTTGGGQPLSAHRTFSPSNDAQRAHTQKRMTIGSRAVQSLPTGLSSKRPFDTTTNTTTTTSSSSSSSTTTSTVSDSGNVAGTTGEESHQQPQGAVKPDKISKKEMGALKDSTKKGSKHKLKKSPSRGEYSAADLVKSDSNVVRGLSKNKSKELKKKRSKTSMKRKGSMACPSSNSSSSGFSSFFSSSEEEKGANVPVPLLPAKEIVALKGALYELSLVQQRGPDTEFIFCTESEVICNMCCHA